MVLILLDLAVLLVLAAAGTQAGAGWAASQVGGSTPITTGEVFVSSTPPELAYEVVTLAYRGILGRDPDSGGLDNYVKHLHDGHRQHRGIVWLCSILLESAEFNSRLADPQALDLATQLHKGIEGCADEEPVKTTRRLLVRARGVPGTTRETLMLTASRAAFLIARTTGASMHLWSEGTEAAASWSVASTLRYLEHAAQTLLTVLQDLLVGMKRAASTRMAEIDAKRGGIDQRVALRAC